jgi:hypothetical protein
MNTIFVVVMRVVKTQTRQALDRRRGRGSVTGVCVALTGFELKD